MTKAIFKYNSGHGALLCSRCRNILKVRYEFTDEEISAVKGEIELEAQYCKKCEDKNE